MSKHPPGAARSRGHLQRLRIFKHFFFAVAPDVIGLLVAQGEVSLRAMEAFESWSCRDGGENAGTGTGTGTGTSTSTSDNEDAGGIPVNEDGSICGDGSDSASTSENGSTRTSINGNRSQADLVQALEHAADDARRKLAEALRSALTTPIGQEDLYVLSERCDRVVNAGKNIVAEAEALGWLPDHRAAKMARHLREGMGQLLEGFRTLNTDPDRAGSAADGATRAARAVERAYRAAMAELLDSSDLRAVFTAREMYRSYARAADLIVAVADRLWYAVFAEL
ncbi:MAG: DUF47 domain-containing protein [Acidimicrobiales bacterium]